MDAPQEEFYYPEANYELVIFDCRTPGVCNRMYRERHAWGPCARVENLGHGFAVLMVRPGGALRLAK